MVTVKLVATLRDSSGNPLPGKLVSFSYSHDGISYTEIASVKTSADGTASTTHTTDKRTYYKAEFKGDDNYDPSIAIATYTPSGVTAPVQPGWLLFALPLLFLLLLALEEERRE
jgi:hypothetical protein